MSHPEEARSIAAEALQLAQLAASAPSALPVAFASPGASVGLTAKTGTASTPMRSDDAPALDQSIAPTWTGSHLFAGGLTLSTISPPQITADQNDYSPTGFLAAGIVRVSSDAPRNITGFDRNGAALVKVFMNVGAFTITFVHNSGASAANKKMLLRGSVNLAVAANDAVILVYDGTSDVWRVVGA